MYRLSTYIVCPVGQIYYIYLCCLLTLWVWDNSRNSRTKVKHREWFLNVTDLLIHIWKLVATSWKFMWIMELNYVRSKICSLVSVKYFSVFKYVCVYLGTKIHRLTLETMQKRYIFLSYDTGTYLIPKRCHL